MVGAIIQVLISGFIIGALARWAVPGPDPMSVPMTILLGAEDHGRDAASEERAEDADQEQHRGDDRADSPARLGSRVPL